MAGNIHQGLVIRPLGRHVDCRSHRGCKTHQICALIRMRWDAIFMLRDAFIGCNEAQDIKHLRVFCLQLLYSPGRISKQRLLKDIQQCLATRTARKLGTHTFEAAIRIVRSYRSVWRLIIQVVLRGKRLTHMEYFMVNLQQWRNKGNALCETQLKGR